MVIDEGSIPRMRMVLFLLHRTSIGNLLILLTPLWASCLKSIVQCTQMSFVVLIFQNL